MPILTGLNSDIISVGLILPEDNIQAITLQWASELGIKCDLNNLSCYETIIDSSNGVLNVDGKPFDGVFHISSNDDLSEIVPQLGIKITPVIAGRGFHWEKRIDAIYPGSIEVSVKDGNLMVINKLNVESYVACVATSEMGAEAPEDLLAAQTVVARCWALALTEKKHQDLGFDVCNDDCCQRYQGTTFLSEYSLEAAKKTEHEIVCYNDTVIDGRYSKNCGGVTEAFDRIWEGEHIPYLVPFWDGERKDKLPDSFDDVMAYDEAYCSSKRFEKVNLSGMLGHVDESGDYYRWTVECPKKDILDLINQSFSLSWSAISHFNILNREQSGRITKLELIGAENGKRTSLMLDSEYKIRQYLNKSFLYSSAFRLSNEATVKDDDVFILEGAGWGHGVGLCQMGALGMALDGIDYESILMHYFPNTKLRKL